MNKFEVRNPKSEIKDRGFTLMELMVVIAIIVLLAGIMVPNLGKRIERAKMTRAEADIAAIESAIAMYENDIGRYPPDSIQQLRDWLTGMDTGTGVDVTIPEAADWHGPYIKGIQQDPWGEDYRYVNTLDGAPYDDPDTCEGIVGTGGCVAPTNLNYYIYSLGKNRDTGGAYDGIGGDDDNEDDVNNWDVIKNWRQVY